MSDCTFAFVPVVDGERLSGRCLGVRAPRIEEAVDRFWSFVSERADVDGIPDSFDIFRVPSAGVSSSSWVAVGELVVEFDLDPGEAVTIH